MKAFVWLSILVLALGACSTPQDTATVPGSSATTNSAQFTNKQEQKKPLVVTTVAPLTNIVSNIAGDRIEIKDIIPEGTYSHTFEPRPSGSDLLSKADLIIVNGLHLESPTEKLADSVKKKDTKVYELSRRRKRYIPPLQSEHLSQSVG